MGNKSLSAPLGGSKEQASTIGSVSQKSSRNKSEIERDTQINYLKQKRDQLGADIVRETFRKVALLAKLESLGNSQRDNDIKHVINQSLHFININISKMENEKAKISDKIKERESSLAISPIT